MRWNCYKLHKILLDVEMTKTFMFGY